MDDPAKPLLSSGTDGAARDPLRTSEGQEAELKKKKCIKWSIIGGLGAIVLTLAIVLPIVLIKPSPPPTPPHPPLPGGLSNPYVQVPGSLKGDSAGTSLRGVL